MSENIQRCWIYIFRYSICCMLLLMLARLFINTLVNAFIHLNLSLCLWLSRSVLGLWKHSRRYTQQQSYKTLTLICRHLFIHSHVEAPFLSLLWTRLCVSDNCQQQWKYKYNNNNNYNNNTTTIRTTKQFFWYSANLHEISSGSESRLWDECTIECIHSTLLNMNEHLCFLRLGLLLLLLLLGFISVGWCQVVAPTWLQQHSRRPTVQAAPVKVTPLNLMETAAIRAQIQKAVNDGTYVVAASPQQVSKYCTL